VDGGWSPLTGKWRQRGVALMVLFLMLGPPVLMGDWCTLSLMAPLAYAILVLSRPPVRREPHIHQPQEPPHSEIE
jgi:hypothetical protein